MQLRLLIALFLMVLVSACRRDEPTRWDVDARAPILEGRLTWSDLLADSLLTVDDNNVLHLVWSDELAIVGLDTLAAIPDTVIYSSYDPPFVGGPVPIPAGNNIISREEDIVLKGGNAELREVHLSAGALTYTVNSYVNGRLDVEYALPGIRLPNGETALLSITSEPGSQNNPWSYSSSIDMAGVEVNLEGESGFSYNRLTSVLDVSTSPNNPGDVQLMGDDSVSVTLSFTGVKVAYAKGYFGQQARELEETTDVNVLAQLEGLLNLDDVELRLDLTNNLGADIRIQPERVAAVGSQSTTDLIHPVLNQALNLTRATDVNGTVYGETISIVVNDETSNITDFLADIPQAIAFEAGFELNPLGNISGNNDFIYADNAFIAELSLDLPLAFGSSGIWLSDTLAAGGFETELVADVALELQITNAFPFVIDDLTLHYLPNEGEPFIFIDGLSIAAGTAESLGSTIPVQSNQTVLLSREQLAAMRGGGSAVLRLRFATYNGEYVRCTGDEYIDIKGIIDGAVQIKFE